MDPARSIHSRSLAISSQTFLIQAAGSVHGSTRARSSLGSADRLNHSGNEVLRAATLSRVIPTPTTTSAGIRKTERLAAACD